jgi:hypothetical protein
VEKPFLYGGDAPIEWTFSQVYDLMKSLEEMGCLNDLAAEADREKMFVSLPPKSVNFVKEFLFQRRLHRTSQKAREVIASVSCGGGPPSGHCIPDCLPCFPSHGEASLGEKEQ